jgi:hypothetical protein
MSNAHILVGLASPELPSELLKTIKLLTFEP